MMDYLKMFAYPIWAVQFWTEPPEQLLSLFHVVSLVGKFETAQLGIRWAKLLQGQMPW